eukprot:scaffold81242_cov21-Tisochrysis_lutea.AAC.2
MLFLQRAAVRRMLALETRGYGTTKEQEAPGPHPFIRKLVSRNGLFIYANLVRRSTRKGEGQSRPPLHSKPPLLALCLHVYQQLYWQVRLMIP